MTKGKFIVIDGPDGSGKETQTKELIKKLDAHNILYKRIDFPQYHSPSSIGVREYLAGNLGNTDEIGPKAASLLFAIDRQGAAWEIREALKYGLIVIANRYVAANMGHQGSFFSNKKERQEYFKWLYELEYEKFEIPKPDLNIILECHPEISEKLIADRNRKGDILEDDVEHQKRATEVFKEITDLFPDFTSVQCLDQEGHLKTKEVISDEIWDTLKQLLYQQTSF